MESKAQAAARVVRHLGLAIKTAALYPESHPGKARTVEVLLPEIRAYTDAHGPFSMHVGKETLSVDDLRIEGSGNLANFLYTRKLSQITIQPAAAEAQISKFLSIVGMERSQLEEAGGVERLLQQAGVYDIQVKELVLRVHEDAEILDLGAFYSLLGQGRLSPQQRDQVVDILRSGSDQVVKLLQNVYALAGEVQRGGGAEGQAQQVYQAIRGLDRIILDEPAERQEPLYENLAGATVLLGQPIERRVVPMLFAGAEDDVAVQVVLNHLSSDQLAEMILTTAGEGATTDRVTTILRGLTLDQEKAQGVLTVLDQRLPQHGTQENSLTDTVMPQLSFPSEEVKDAPPLMEFDESLIAIPAEELAAYRKEAQSINEADAARQALITLLDILGNEVEQKELLDVADALAGYLHRMIERGDFALLRESLETLKATSSTATAARGEVINALLDGVATGPFLDGVLAALSEGRHTPVAREIRACVRALGDRVVGPLLRMLGVEQRREMLDVLCDLLAGLGAEHVDALGAFVTDERWFLVRSVADVLGRMRSPAAIPYLARLVRHADSRVRMETVKALASIGTDAAQAKICDFLQDADLTIRLWALSSLDAKGMRVAVPVLVTLLEMPDLLNRRFILRRAAIKAVANAGVREVLPSLKKIARTPFALGGRRRELRQLAHMAVVSIEKSAASQAADGNGSRP